MQEGMWRHGVTSRLIERHEEATAPLVVRWNIRHKDWFEARGQRLLVMERPFIHSRETEQWYALGFDHLCGRGVYPEGGPQRWESWGMELKPWRTEGYALLCGQSAVDMATRGVNMQAWLPQTAKALEAAGWQVRYRPHPRAKHLTCPRHRSSTRSLAEDLAEAGLVVTWNSNAGVDAFLNGCPAVAMDCGSSVWGDAFWDIPEPPVTEFPDREAWAQRMAWREWSLEEITRGEAWEALKALI